MTVYFYIAAQLMILKSSIFSYANDMLWKIRELKLGSRWNIAQQIKMSTPNTWIHNPWEGNKFSNNEMTKG